MSSWSLYTGNSAYRPRSVCLLFYVLTTSKITSGWILTCDRAHSWWHSAASLGHQVAGTMTCYPTHSHYPDTEQISPHSILIMLSARLGSDKYKFLSLWFDSTRFRTHGLQTWTCDLQIPRSPETGGGHSFGHPNWSVHVRSSPQHPLHIGYHRAQCTSCSTCLPTSRPCFKIDSNNSEHLPSWYLGQVHDSDLSITAIYLSELYGLFVSTFST